MPGGAGAIHTIRINYADTCFGKPRQTQAAKLFDGLQASGWLTEVLSRIADHKINRIENCCLGVTLQAQRN